MLPSRSSEYKCLLTFISFMRIVLKLPAVSSFAAFYQRYAIVCNSKLFKYSSTSEKLNGRF